MTKNKTVFDSKQVLKAVPYLCALTLWLVLILCENHYLRKVEDLSLFLFDKLFLIEAFKTPGGFIGLAGSFLTQFLYYPILGSAIWVILLLLTAHLTKRAFDLPHTYAVLAYIPAVLLIISNMSLGYNVYIMRGQENFFGPTLGYLFLLSPLFIIKNLKNNNYLAIAIMLCWTAVTYPLAGVYSVVSTLTTATFVLFRQEGTRSKRRLIATTTCVIALLIPFLSYGFYTSFRIADAWTIGLPVISEDTQTTSLRWPYYLLLLFAIVMPLVVKFTDNSKLTQGNRTIIINSTLAGIYLLAITLCWYKDENFHTELAMSQAVDSSDWETVVKIYRDVTERHIQSDAKAYNSRSAQIAKTRDNNEIQDIIDKYEKRFFEPTRSMVVYKDLALLKLNMALDLSFTMKDGGRPQNSPIQIPMVTQSGKQIYMHLGLANMSYRWCLEDVIEHDWSYSTLKYMVIHSVIMQESEFAEKYINKLSKTLFYRKWALEQRELKDNASLMAASLPYSEILPYMSFDNKMSNDVGRIEPYIMNHFLEDRSPQATPEFDRAALLYAMRTQDIPHFWECLLNYINTNGVSSLPNSVQEAIILYTSLEKDGIELPADKVIRDRYDSFNRYVNSHPIRSMKESSYPYSQQFGKTFFYYYYFIRNLQTY